MQIRWSENDASEAVATLFSIVGRAGATLSEPFISPPCTSFHTLGEPYELLQDMIACICMPTVHEHSANTRRHRTLIDQLIASLCATSHANSELETQHTGWSLVMQQQVQNNYWSEGGSSFSQLCNYPAPYHPSVLSSHSIQRPARNDVRASPQRVPALRETNERADRNILTPSNSAARSMAPSNTMTTEASEPLSAKLSEPPRSMQDH